MCGRPLTKPIRLTPPRGVAALIFRRDLGPRCGRSSPTRYTAPPSADRTELASTAYAPAIKTNLLAERRALSLSLPDYPLFMPLVGRLVASRVSKRMGMDWNKMLFPYSRIRVAPSSCALVHLLRKCHFLMSVVLDIDPAICC